MDKPEQPQKSAQWEILDPDDETNMAVKISRRGPVFIQGLASVNEKGMDIIIMARGTLPPGGENGSMLSIIIPGLCGHYSCGEGIGVQLN